MRTRSQGAPLVPLDPEIEATARRRRGRRGRVVIQPLIQEPIEEVVEAMADPNQPNGEAPNVALLLQQMQQQMQQQLEQQVEAMRAQFAAEAAPNPVRNQFANVQPPGPVFQNGIEANNFELRTGLLSMVQQNQFAGRATEDAYRHLTRFLSIADTVKQNGVSQDTIRTRLFEFSLTGAAQDWFDCLPRGSITTWNDLSTKFLAKFFPLSTTLKLQAEIAQFSMKGLETLGEAWERFLGLLRKCPNHGVALERQITIFYNGCTDEYKTQLDFGSNGSFLDQSAEKCKNMLEKLASNSQGWSSGRGNSCRVAAATNSDGLSLLTQQMAMLNQKVDEMRGAPVEQPGNVEDVSYVHNGGQNRNFNNNYRSNQGNGGYNNNRNHSNLSYGNPNNGIQPPPGFNVSEGGVIVEPKSAAPTQEELLRAILARGDQYMAEQATTSKRVTQLETVVSGMATQMKLFETQLGQIAQAVSSIRQPGTYPSQPEENPKQCKAIYVSSGESEQGPLMPVGSIEVEQPEEEGMEKGLTDTSLLDTSPRVKVPYPTRVKKQKENEQFSKFLDIFRKVNINIPLVEALQRMPSYVKFLKDVLSKKKKVEDYEKVSVIESCKTISLEQLPAKLKDPGSFSITCVIGNDRQTKAMCDLGASISLMPLSFFRKLKIGTLKPTTTTLQMADGSIKHPNGIIEDVLVQVNNFIFPVDFFVLDMQETETPLILGRPFLATSKALIDVSKGELTFRSGAKKEIWSIYNAMRKPTEAMWVAQAKKKVIHTVASITVKEEDFKELKSGDEVAVVANIERKPIQVKTTKEGDDPSVVKPKFTWWKKKLTQLYLTEVDKERDVNKPIRLRMS